MTGLDLLLIVFVVVLVAAHLKQQRINRKDRERAESRAAVHNILRATGQLR